MVRSRAVREEETQRQQDYISAKEQIAEEQRQRAEAERQKADPAEAGRRRAKLLAGVAALVGTLDGSAELLIQARRTIRNRQDGNPFATDAVIADLIEAPGAAYLAAPNQRAGRPGRWSPGIPGFSGKCPGSRQQPRLGGEGRAIRTLATSTIDMLLKLAPTPV
jgi:hypothetical protein